MRSIQGALLAKSDGSLSRHVLTRRCEDMLRENGAYIRHTARERSTRASEGRWGMQVRTCFLSTMLAGRTRRTSAPSDCNAFTFSSATSSGMMMAFRGGKHAGPLKSVWDIAHSCHNPCQRDNSSFQRWKRRWGFQHYLAFDIVAIEIPVDPTVPSNIREPVFGCNNPCRSASWITVTDA